LSAVGFDLDMTLVDTRRGIEAALLALATDTGRPVDAAAIVANLGPPIHGALAPWFAPDELDDAEHADVALPGAGAAMDAVRAAGHQVIVITSKIEPLALATLANAGLVADRVFGNVWAEGKAEPLRVCDAVCYVGDHPGDMIAATTAEVPGFGVTSGASSRDELIAAGAAHVEPSLVRFPTWLDELPR
jgi:phosphoglycolate phosphatase